MLLEEIRKEVFTITHYQRNSKDKNKDQNQRREMKKEALVTQ